MWQQVVILRSSSIRDLLAPYYLFSYTATNYDFLSVQSTIIWSIIKMVEGFGAKISLVVPSSQPFHSFAVNTETPSSRQVEQLLKDEVAMVLDC